MAKVNGNLLAVAIAKREGKKDAVNIGQIKEVLRCLQDEVGQDDQHTPSEWLAWLGM
jgi:hypothetical protein